MDRPSQATKVKRLWKLLDDEVQQDEDNWLRKRIKYYLFGHRSPVGNWWWYTVIGGGNWWWHGWLAQRLIKREREELKEG